MTAELKLKGIVIRTHRFFNLSKWKGIRIADTKVKEVGEVGSSHLILSFYNEADFPFEKHDVVEITIRKVEK